ncbi:MAG: dienelactone hydrolase family protein [Acetobacteraceae bacterium]|nr:dienelactone hydrolase family protein [Acetobacteraceae bacterium]
MSRLLLLLLTALTLAASLPARAGQSEIMVGTSGRMHATLITPDGPGPYPGVLVLHTSGGLREADLAYARALAKAGYVALVPAFLNAYAISYSRRQESFTTSAEPIYADLVSALDTLRQNALVRGGKLGAVGFSNGGYFAMWLAATGKVSAGVSYYGALSGAGSDVPQQRFQQAFAKASAPVLILHGTADRIVPVGAAKHLAGIVAAAGSVHELRLYEGATHEFERDLALDANQQAATDAWTRTTAFFGTYLSK